MVPQGGGADTHARTHTHTHTEYMYTYIRQTGSSFGLYLSPEVQESAIYIHISAHTRKNIYRYTRVHTRTYIKPSTPSSVSYLFLCFAISSSNVSFRVPFPRLAFMASIHGSGEIRVPSSPKLVIET